MNGTTRTRSSTAIKRRRQTMNGGSLPVNFMGGPTVDPTENVKDLSEALSQRQDDLREVNNEYLKARMDAIEQVAELRAEHAKELSALNNDRLEKIRAVDNLNASRSEERAGEGIKALAMQTASIAEAGRTTAANTAAQIATQLTTLFAESNKRLSALELSSSEGRGKQAVSDPQMERLASMVEKLATREAAVTGKSEGMSDSVKMVLAALTFITAMLGFYTFTQRGAPAQPQAQVIYVPAPAGALLPTTPQQTPR